jgi:type I restriction enzyme S subunit
MGDKLSVEWETVNLFDIAEVYTGRKDANYATEDGEYPFFTCAFSPLKSSDFSFQGNVLILPGNGVNVGEVFYFSGKFEAYQRTYIVDKIKINPKYLFYHFKQFWRKRGASEQFGSATNYIKIGNFKSYIVEYPPLPEQERIVSKLDSIFAHLEMAKQGLEKIPVLLKEFRQAVLTQAVTGKLTEEWREGKELVEGLSIILKNRFTYFEQLLNDSQLNNTKKPKKLDETEFELNYWKNGIVLPNSWKLSNLKNLADMITDGEHATPRRTESGNLLLSARNVRDGFISIENVDYVPDDEFERIKTRCFPEENDILISCSGTVGRISLVPKNLKFVLVRSVALVKLQSNSNFSKYLAFALRSRLIQDQMLSLQKSTAQANLFIGPIGKIVIPIPPSEEQNEIVRRVDALFSKADAIEAQYKKLKVQINQLPQAVLAKAFRGEV